MVENQPKLMGVNNDAENKMNEAGVHLIRTAMLNGETFEDVVNLAVKKGYDREQSNKVATALFTRALQQQDAPQNHDSEKATKNIVVGAIILLIGVVITASRVGVIAYGAIIVGAIRLITGISQASK